MSHSLNERGFCWVEWLQCRHPLFFCQIFTKPNFIRRAKFCYIIFLDFLHSLFSEISSTEWNMPCFKPKFYHISYFKWLREILFFSTKDFPSQGQIWKFVNWLNKIWFRLMKCWQWELIPICLALPLLFSSKLQMHHNTIYTKQNKILNIQKMRRARLSPS